jgi:hypothetical protein
MAIGNPCGDPLSSESSLHGSIGRALAWGLGAIILMAQAASRMRQSVILLHQEAVNVESIYFPYPKYHRPDTVSIWATAPGEIGTKKKIG